MSMYRIPDDHMATYGSDAFFRQQLGCSVRVTAIKQKPGSK